MNISSFVTTNRIISHQKMSSCTFWRNRSFWTQMKNWPSSRVNWLSIWPLCELKIKYSKWQLKVQIVTKKTECFRALDRIRNQRMGRDLKQSVQYRGWSIVKVWTKTGRSSAAGCWKTLMIQTTSLLCRTLIGSTAQGKTFYSKLNLLHRPNILLYLLSAWLTTQELSPRFSADAVANQQPLSTSSNSSRTRGPWIVVLTIKRPTIARSV